MTGMSDMNTKPLDDTATAVSTHFITPGYTVKHIRISTDILWQVFHNFNGTGSVYVRIRKSTE